MSQRLEAAEFLYPPFRWRDVHRFLAVRRPTLLEPEDVQTHLFSFKHYNDRRALATNLALKPLAVWHFYCRRRFQELLLQDFKGAHAMAKIPTRSLWANATYIEMSLWAYDMVLALQFLCQPTEVQHRNISTLCRELWWLPAERARRDNPNLLILPPGSPRHDLFLKIQQAIAKISSLI